MDRSGTCATSRVGPLLLRERASEKRGGLGPDAGVRRAQLRSVLREARAHGVGVRVHALGHLDGDALQEAYASLDLLVAPSDTESFGNMVIEALAQGTEVLVSDGVALAAYVTEHGLGRVVESLRPEAWQAALEQWIRDPRDWSGAAAARRVRGDYSLERIGKRWVEELSRII